VGQQLVLFDLDNTLANREEAFSRWAQAFSATQGIDSAGCRWLIEQDADGFRPRREFFAVVKERFGLPDSVEELLMSYRSAYPRCYRHELASASVIRSLRRLGFKIAVVTNGEPSQADKIRLIGIAELVDAVCISSVVGSRKPSPVIFDEAARQCEAPLSGWMVGDSPEADIRGGHQVGLTTIWIDRGRTWPLDDLRPDFSVTTVSEAGDIIARAVKDDPRLSESATDG
jgi:FMN phosphatase YigB (HAD superfamily)